MSPDLKVYKTLVRIDGTHEFLRTRMSCKVTILVETIVDAVIVPSETRPQLIDALEIMCAKREVRPPKKHGNIPL